MARAPTPRSTGGAKAGFVPPMLLLRTDALPDDSRWVYELKLDGYRAIAFRTRGVTHLRSRNDNDFTRRYRGVVKGLARLPDETILDGEVVALDAEGRPSFNALQHDGGGTFSIVFFVFDVLMLAGVDLMGEPLSRRQAILLAKVVPALDEPARVVAPLEAELPVLVESVKAFGFEGLVAKRRDSRYEPGLRSGAWLKMRVNRGQALVIGGYTVGGNPFDALIIGYYEGGRLIYAARTRSGFTPAVRTELFKRLRALETAECPFANLPEARSGRWGSGLTAAKMPACRWVKPVLVGQFAFVEWTADHHLRHVRFIGLRQDKAAHEVTRE